MFFYRLVLLLAGRPHFQERVLLLPHPVLHSVLHAGYGLVGELLARPACSAGPRLARRHDAPHNEHAKRRHKPVAATCVLY